MLRDHALTIWQAAVAAANPRELVRIAMTNPDDRLRDALNGARRLLVTGAGKAGLPMCQGVMDWLTSANPENLTVEGWVNVPDPDAGQSPIANRKSPITLHGSRPAGSNHPTERGVAGAEQILQLVAGAGPEDVGLCLLSGGGSALLPAPISGVPLEDKQQVTRLLHACGATINEMNAVRKHLSRIKGGRLAEAFVQAGGRALFSLIISDVVGDPLDVIASGPTSPDPTTYHDALEVLDRYQLGSKVPGPVWEHLRRGARGEVPETPKDLPATVQNLVLGNNARALQAAAREAERLGYAVLNLGSYIEGETTPAATTLAAVMRGVLTDGLPRGAPLCVLSGGETTVTLGEHHGKGGRNQEFALAAGLALSRVPLLDQGPAWVVLCAGTDGEDGPTDAAGATADTAAFARAQTLGLNPADFLARHDAYSFWAATGGLVQTGLTGTNVMDVRVFLVR
jgi:glycerate 2-kinase